MTEANIRFGSRNDLEASVKPVIYTKWSFGATEAVRRQKETAQALGVPVQRTIDLGGGAGLELVLIPAGEFDMGSPAGEKERDQDEGPVHRVRIERPFSVGKYEVTQQQWQAVMGNDPSSFKGNKNPVECVSWYDSRTFLIKLSLKTGLKCRLPSEAEWEYACRAGTKTPFYFGETISASQANYEGSGKGLNRQRTTSVGSFPPNAWGLYDMHGNIWEWCKDKYHESYQGAPTYGSAWVDGGEGRPVLRGGSWARDAGYTRSARRLRRTSWRKFHWRGLRVVADLCDIPGVEK